MFLMMKVKYCISHFGGTLYNRVHTATKLLYASNLPLKAPKTIAGPIVEKCIAVMNVPRIMTHG